MNKRPELTARIRAALASPSGRLDHLVKVTGVDPASDLRFGDWSGLDLSNADLRGFDFTGADLRASRFDNARIAGAIFEGARYDPVALRKAADFDQNRVEASDAVDQERFELEQVVKVLAGIGPDRISADLMTTFSQMIWTAISSYEKRTGRRDSSMRTAANLPSFELLMALWKRTGASEGREPVRPILLAKQIEEARLQRLSEPRAHRVIEHTLALLESDASPSDIQRSLFLSSQSRVAIKKSLMDAARALQQLGLVEVRTGLRGARQFVISEILLTEYGMAFVKLLLRHSISSSADQVLDGVYNATQSPFGRTRAVV